MSLLTTLFAWVLGPVELSVQDLEVLGSSEPRHVLIEEKVE